MTTTTRHPDEILADFDAGCAGQADVDMRGVLWEVIEDMLDSLGGYGSLEFYDESPDGVVAQCKAMLTDYVVNHYGDD